MVIDRDKIPELKPKYLQKLTPEQQSEILKRWRLVKEYEDGTAYGKVLIDNVTTATWLEFREEISKKHFANKDGPAFAAMVQVFLMFKAMERKDNGSS